MSSSQVPVMHVSFNETLIFSTCFLKYSNIKFHKNPSSGSRVVPCGRTDMTRLIVAIRNFANSPKKQKKSGQFTSLFTFIRKTSPSFAAIFREFRDILRGYLVQILIGMGPIVLGLREHTPWNSRVCLSPKQ